MTLFPPVSSLRQKSKLTTKTTHQKKKGEEGRHVVVFMLLKNANVHICIYQEKGSRNDVMVDI